MITVITLNAIRDLYISVILYRYNIYRICHELTVQINFYETSPEKMLLSSLKARLMIFFRTSLMKFYLNSQRMSDSFYHITERTEVN